MLVIGAACSGGGHAHKLAAAERSSSSTVETTSTTSAAGAVAAPAPTSATTAPPNVSNDRASIVVITDADSGKTFTLQRGNQGITVQLSNGNVWSDPQVSNAQVLTRTSGSTNGDGSAQATFMATADGQATVNADGRPHPCANPPCATPAHVVAFQVTVNVVG